LESITSLTVLRVPLDSLIPDPANPRVHDDANLSAIRASLQRFGQAEPVVVQAKTRRIIAGHGRVSAMKALGWHEVDIVELPVDDLTATALGVAMNRAGELASWNDHALAPILKALEDQGSLDGVGFSSADLDSLLKQLEADSAQDRVDDPGPDAPPKIAAARSGDLWLLGDSRLLCGDSTNLDDVRRVMGDDRANLVATDPPGPQSASRQLTDECGKEPEHHPGPFAESAAVSVTSPSTQRRPKPAERHNRPLDTKRGERSGPVARWRRPHGKYVDVLLGCCVVKTSIVLLRWPHDLKSGPPGRGYANGSVLGQCLDECARCLVAEFAYVAPRDWPRDKH